MDVAWATSLEGVIASQEDQSVKSALQAALLAAKRYPAEFCEANTQLRVRVLGMFLKTHAAMGVALKEITETTRRRIVAVVDAWATEHGVALDK